MTDLQILTAVRDHCGIQYTELLNIGKSGTDFNPTADRTRICALIKANYLRGNLDAYASLHLTDEGEDHLQTLQQEENRRIAEEKRWVSFSSQMQELVAAAQSQAKAAKAKAETAEKDAKHARKISNISITLAVISTLAAVASVILSYLFGMHYLP